MKTTKKSVYAEYDIEYKNGKILTPLGWSCELLKKGNSKTGAAVLTWSMDQTTCICHCEGCYADYGCYNFAGVKRSLAFNTKLAREHMDFLERALMAQLETLPAGTEIRIHAVGDFFNNEYVEMWRRIVKAFPDLIFWTYTKTEHDGAFDGFKNANIVKSVIGGQLNFGHCDHVISLYRELYEAGKNVHVCRCGIDDNQHCAGCHKCSSSEYVLFVEHSTGYEAKEDPLFPELEKIINNQ